LGTKQASAVNDCAEARCHRVAGKALRENPKRLADVSPTFHRLPFRQTYVHA
jgi:hypothetical protein